MAATTVGAPKSLTNLFCPPAGTGDKCQRCDERVYLVEKIAVNEVIFHRQCFKCAVCEGHLMVKTYYTNRVEFGDKEIYCAKHIPKSALLGYDVRALGIRNALQTPNLNKPFNAQILPTGHAPLIGNEAISIMGPVNAQNQFRMRYNKHSNARHHYPAFVAKKKSKIYDAQTDLEKVQRQEEDVLMEVFRAERTQEKKKIDKEIDDEWEERLRELTANFDADRDKRGGGHKGKDDDKKAMSMKYNHKKNQLKESMTVKLKQKQEAITMRMRKKEQQDTADMVQKHSEQMLSMLKVKQQEIRQEIEEELKDAADDEGHAVDTAIILEEVTIVPIELPEFHPPNCRKRDLYYDADVFKELDEYVFSVAEKEQSTFTDLVAELTQNCLTDLEKARAIFRWITVKDLNMLEFEEVLEKDTPMGLLRGIKYGTETYHTLFMRLCSYAGLPCVEIKGHSKSVGYEPGMKIREDTFQNTWNAVLVGGNWWPVQCNWGARHLVMNKDAQEKLAKTKKQDKIRYQYDEHYFLTDPDEFIREFWASDEEKQMLDKPISLEQFEQMPFVRSVFFHYGLEFNQRMRTVLYADNKGGTEVKVDVPSEYAKDLVFHYQIRFADRERRNGTEFRGAKLERFVFHSLVESQALFSVHVPAPGSYFLEVFANRIDDTNKIGDDPNATMMPFRLKCACKFKIVCEEMVGKMHPLPNCASGEWGPSKGERHFGLRAMTHITGVVSVDNDMEMKFKLPRKLHFLCKLRMNGVEDAALEKFVNFSVYDAVLTVKVNPPQTGQYGIDIYARPEDATDNHTLAHACKYLLNVTGVDDAINVPVSKVDPSSRMSKDKWGPNELFHQIGMRTVSHTDPTITKTDTGTLIIEIAMSEAVKLSYNLTREPDEDCRNVVSMKDNGKKVKFSLSLAKPGNYLFAVYARKKKDNDRNMANVYNYMIKYAPEEKLSTLKKKKGLFSKK